MVKSHSLSPIRLQRIVKKSLYPHFLRSLLTTCLDNSESGKRNYCLGKNSGKCLEFWIQKSERTMKVTFTQQRTNFSHGEKFDQALRSHRTVQFIRSVHTEPTNQVEFHLFTDNGFTICPWAQRYFSTSKMAFSNYVFAVQKFRR